MNNYTYTYACRNIFNSIKTSGQSSLEKNIPLTLSKGLCVRGSWRPNQDCNILTAQLFWLSKPFFPVVLGCSTGDLVAKPLLGHGSHSSIFSPTDSNFLCTELYYCFTPTLNSNRRQSRLSPDILDRMHLLFTLVHFLFWLLGRIGGQYAINSHQTHPFYLKNLELKVRLYL